MKSYDLSELNILVLEKKRVAASFVNRCVL